MVTKEELASAIIRQWVSDGFTDPDNPDLMDAFANVLGTTGADIKANYMKRAVTSLSRDTRSQKPPSSGE